MRNYPTLEVVPPTTRERLAYIDFALMFKGQTNRVEICRRFNVYPTQVTKDFVLYKQFAPENLSYDAKLRMQVRGPNFKPLFEYHVSKILSSISHGFGDGMDSTIESNFPIETPYLFNEPNLDVLSKVTESFDKGVPIKIRYISLSSGEQERVIIPHTIVNNGLRWHVRGFDRLRGEFRDFVITRIKSAECVIEDSINEFESKEFDHNWNETIELVLAPHPNITHKEAIELDYCMVKAERKLKVRKANADYLLRLWNVDCSLKGTLKGPEFHLWLKNAEFIQNQMELVLAPM
ncbi:helix-turn-helix transcriptional regulator [Thorsellia anophelis]|uniref:WYL domain-containing protein n=1 Tax=Thorsellia anophelis DSM 18579 TaxID=1123402 RepID=A0A1I0BIP7_9GAMM|nr:WYL domain-containing protein [Thorsellia anophelis]SET06806.1 WYL domain-containing protein [Thorsellia anophelis DSM 18579]